LDRFVVEQNRPLEKSNEQTCDMMLLITGIPGTGKTTIGNYLQTHKGYDHLDVEAPTGPRLEEFLSKHGDKKVITGGFVPGASNSVIINLQRSG
jgi:hypothetical protein